jgi:hypothetical protein
MKDAIPLSPRCAARSRCSRALIILAGQQDLVESGMPCQGSSVTPVVPERGGKGKRKAPRSGRRKPRLDPHTPLSEIIAAPPVVARLLA